MTDSITDPGHSSDQLQSGKAPSTSGPRPSLRELRAAQPAPMSEGYVGLLYRQFSLPVSWLLVRTPMTANQVSVAWMVLGLVASVCLALGTHAWAIVGALLLQLVAILDRVDGEVARYKQSQSLLGLFWDLAGHILIKSFLFIGISLGIYRSHTDFSVILLGISAASSLVVGLNLRLYQKYILLKAGVASPRRPAAQNFFRKFSKKLENVWWTLGLFGIILVGALLNQLYYVLIFYGVATPLWALSVLIRAAREVRAEDRLRLRDTEAK